MTTPHDSGSDSTRRGPESYAEFMRLWADNFQKWAGSLPPPDTKMLNQVVDNCFDAAERVLENQREFTKNFVTATASAVTRVASAVQDVAKNAASKQS